MTKRVTLRFASVCAVILGGAACGKPAMSGGPASPAVAENPPAIRIGEKFKLFSKVLNEERQYWVHLPETYKGGRASPTSYPVLYLLDGEAHFQSAVAMVDFLTRYAMIPEMIVVGVLSTDRMHDMTPTHIAKGPHGEVEPRVANSGGGEPFERFLDTELIPKIEATYATMPYRVLVGHSLGGLLALHAALKAPTPFNAVIAMDPSLWWDDQFLVKQTEKRLGTPDARLKSIYVSTGALPLDNGEDATAGRTALGAFASVLARRASSTFRAETQVFEHDNHQSVAFRGLYDGLLFTFEGYKLSTSAALEDPSRIDAHYKELTTRFGVEWHAPQRLIDLVSFSLLFEQKKVDEAIRLLSRNAKVYPNSSAAHEHLGQAYLIKGDKASAVRCFERALELDPSDEETRAQIAQLREK